MKGRCETHVKLWLNSPPYASCLMSDPTSTWMTEIFPKNMRRSEQFSKTTGSFKCADVFKENGEAVVWAVLLPGPAFASPF